MHDELLERRLRSALHADADGLPFTITAAELERRNAARGRTAGTRRLTLLLAATVAIGALGAGAILGGLARPEPSPTPATALASPTAGTSADSTPPRAGPGLPSLDQLIAIDPLNVLVASAHGPFDRPAEAHDIGRTGETTTAYLGTVHARGDYVVSGACFAPEPLVVNVVPAEQTGAETGSSIECDGAVVEHVVRVDGPADVFLGYRGPMSWRVAVRAPRATLPAGTSDPDLPFLDSRGFWVRVIDSVIPEDANPWGDGTLRMQDVGAMPAVPIASVQLWCEPGASMRVVFGHRIDGVVDPGTEAQIACDGLVHDLSFSVPEPGGSQVFVAATAGARWSVVVSSDAPPIQAPGTLEGIPGWQEQVAYGPEFSLDDQPVSLSIPGVDGGGRVMVVFACAGTAPIDVTVEVGELDGDKQEHLAATCTAEGATTAMTYDVPTSNVHLSYVPPSGTWTAVSVLVPDPLPTPR